MYPLVSDLSPGGCGKWKMLIPDIVPASTRCVRFANDIAGVEELGTSGRGNDMQIGTYIEKTLNSEMSGNIIDLCPVGALLARPYESEARPWELAHTESVDVLDAVGSNIRIDSRGLVVMRIQPRLNEDINEEWINDKTRFAYDGLKSQRLTTPLIKVDGKFEAATWPQALNAIKEGLASTGAKGNEIQAMAGSLADTESLVALKDLINKLGSDNTILDQPLGTAPPAHGTDFRSNYSFNTTLAGAEEADKLILIGTNPRHEAAILNARLRKAYLSGSLDIALIGTTFESTFGYDHLGTTLSSVQDLFNPNSTSSWAKALRSAKKPMIVIGSGVTEHGDGKAVYEMVAKFVEKNQKTFITEEWNGFNVLQRVSDWFFLSHLASCTNDIILQAASRTAAYDVGFTPSTAASTTAPKFVYLLNADDFATTSIPAGAFVVYQGHHGDLGASFADVCLPGSAYTEKSATWVNTEGRTQLGRAAVGPPGAAREDWKIIRALSEVLEQRLGYDDIGGMRDRMWDVSPTLTAYDHVEAASTALVGLQAIGGAAGTSGAGGATKREAFGKTVQNFYRTDPISRASVTMARCTVC